ncbi:hypothetical protein A2U01_0094364, partial [Trifolium medium]|nr:hypothetical protein [Trifolium medium]
MSLKLDDQNWISADCGWIVMCSKVNCDLSITRFEIPFTSMVSSLIYGRCGVRFIIYRQAMRSVDIFEVG